MGASSRTILADRYRNKGTAFSREERDALGLHGLLPDVVEDLDTQLARIRSEYDSKRTDIDRHVFLRALQERNSVTFYAFLARHLAELLPIVYTPTVGLACQEWSTAYRREHGLFISWRNRERIPEMLDNLAGGNDVDVIVVTDGERILGLGDLGCGGMGIPIGKLALYTGVGGIDPAKTLPVMLDVGTDNEALRSDPLYLGVREPRLRGDRYDELVELFIDAVVDRFPSVLLQWEDFAQSNATRLLERYRDRICSFNDDIQGTAVVAMGAIAAGMRKIAFDLTELRLVIAGAGSAGTGIAAEAVRLLCACGLDRGAALDRIWLVDQNGLLCSAESDLQVFQRPYAKSADAIARAGLDPDAEVPPNLHEVVASVAPTALVGVTGQSGLFDEALIRAVSANVERPIILPLSNPTARAEATPTQILQWSEGRALVGTGSPFPPIRVEGGIVDVSQVNNIYVFPGVGLGVLASKASRVTDGMLTAAALELASMSSSDDDQLLPRVDESPRVARSIAGAVARRAVEEGIAPKTSAEELDDAIDRISWNPGYRQTVLTQNEGT